MVAKKTSRSPKTTSPAPPPEAARKAPPKAAAGRARKKTAAAKAVRRVVTDEDIRIRAYFLSLDYLGGDRNDVDFWLLAERELRGK